MSYRTYKEIEKIRVVLNMSRRSNAVLFFNLSFLEGSESSQFAAATIVLFALTGKGRGV